MEVSQCQSDTNLVESSENSNVTDDVCTPNDMEIDSVRFQLMGHSSVPDFSENDP